MAIVVVIASHLFNGTVGELDVGLADSDFFKRAGMCSCGLGCKKMAGAMARRNNRYGIFNYI